MPAYVYRAKKESAETVVGEITAQNQEEAIDLINQLGLLPVSVEEHTVQGQPLKRIRHKKVNQKEIYFFTRQLASLIKSGVPLLQSIEILSRQSSNAYLGKILSDISVSVKNGRSLSSALGDFPGIFSPLYLAMIHAGEESGNLKEMLYSLTEYQKKQQEITSKVQSALVYPAFMLLVGFGTVIFILTFVMPRITKLFTDIKQALPWPTVIVMKLSDIIRTSGAWGLIALVTVIILVGRWAKTPSGQTAISRIVLYIPLIRNLVIKTDLARFCRTFQLLLKSGLPILKSMETAIPVLSNQLMKKEIINSAESLTGGSSLGDTLAHSTLMPELMAQLIKVGEESGSLTQSLGDIAESYEQEISDYTKFMTTILEPFLILTVGTVIGFIVFAMLLPIFQMDIFAR